MICSSSFLVLRHVLQDMAVIFSLWATILINLNLNLNLLGVASVSCYM